MVQAITHNKRSILKNAIIRAAAINALLIPVAYYLFADSLPIRETQIFLVLCGILLVFKPKIKRSRVIVFTIGALLIACAYLIHALHLYYRSSLSATIVSIGVLLLISTFELQPVQPYVRRLSVRYAAYTYALYSFASITLTANSLSSSRFKFFGSGTTSAIICGVYICCLISDRHFSSQRSKIIDIVAILTLFVSIILTQVRGVVIALLMVYVIIKTRRLMSSYFIKQRITFFKPRIHIRVLFILLLLGVSLYALLQIGSLQSFVDRFDIVNYDNLEHLTSGRSHSQLYIMNEMSNSSFLSLAMGHGFGSFQALTQSQGLEFPHFDPLLIGFEGGLVFALIYCYLIFDIMKKFRYSPAILFFIICTLHTNLLLWPSSFIAISLMLEPRSSHKVSGI